jgi:putative oxidoreductase
MINKIFGPFVPGRAAFGLLAVRIVFGIGLIEHGWGKIQHPFSWMPGGAVPGWLQSLAALSEFGGGMAMIVGLLTPLALFGIICTMGFAMLHVHFPKHQPYINPAGPSYEAAAHYFIVALGLLIAGPGVLSVDAYLFNRPPAVK